MKEDFTKIINELKMIFRFTLILLLVFSVFSSSATENNAIDSFTSTFAITVKGTVKDADGRVMPGVSVLVKGTNIGTTTNANGTYSLANVDENAVLEFSFIGFKTQQVAVNSRTVINVTMSESSSVLDEVVVTGYTSTVRRDLTGAVGIVNIADLQKAPVRSFEEALAGRVAGVQVVSQDGKPGSNINILIRGIGSISQSSSPLYVIDGLAIENPDNNLIDPDNIESLNVLKDASSTAIYGARGSNGVIVITTKRGQSGDSKVSYNGNYGINSPVKFMKLLSPYEFVKVISEQFGVGSNPYLSNGLTLEDYRGVRGVDWQEKLLRTGRQENHSVNVSGGRQGTLYSVSGNYLGQEGIMINSGYRRYQGKITLDQVVGKKGKVGGFLTYTSSNMNGTNPTANGASSLFYHAYTYRPIPIPGIAQEDLEEALYDPSNGLADYRVNPILSVENEIRNNINNNLLGNVYVAYDILKNLKLTLRGSVNSNLNRIETFNGSGTRSGGPNGSNGINGSVNNYKNEVLDNTNLLEYNTTINKKHRITGMLGTGIQSVKSNAYGYSATQIPAESLGLSGLDAGIIGTSPLARISTNTLMSGFGSINYIFDNKYYVTGNFRSDGTSKFIGKNRWSYFPSGAVKWKFSEEQFFKNQTILSDGNIRFSYGETGNNRVGDFDTYALIQFQSPLFLNGVSQGNSAVTTSLANPALKWETAKSTDLGFDLGFLKNRLNLTVDLYKKSTKDLLYRTSLPGSTGFNNTIKNIASISNRGLEVTLSADVIHKKDFSFNSSFNITFNRNRLDALADPSEEAITSTVNWEALFSNVPAYIAKIGGPLGQIYGLVSDGLFQYSDFDKLPNGTYVLKGNLPSRELAANRAATQPGDNRYVDLNNDGQISPDDRTVIGNGYPLHVGGWSNNLRYKNFDINIFFQWSYGNDVINANRLWFDPGLGIQQRSSLFSGQNTFAEFANRWTPENQNTDIPRLNRVSAGVYSSQYVEDGSYLRLKTLNVGYTLPNTLLSRYKISKLRVYMATSNIYTWTKYKGYDPEVAAFQTGLTPSLDYSTFPRPLTITGGINLTF